MSAYEGSKMQEMDEDRKRHEETFGKKKASLQEPKLQSNIPDGENDWWVGSETFTRQGIKNTLYPTCYDFK